MDIQKNLENELSYFEPNSINKVPTIPKLAQVHSNLPSQAQKDGSLRVEWTHRPSTCLVAEKKGDEASRNYLIQVAKWLMESRQIIVFVEPYVAKSLSEMILLKPFNGEHIDIVFSFGGDGTLLHIASLFPEYCPPIVPFSLGSLGFLTPFTAEDFRSTIDDVIQGPFYVCNRTQISITITRKDGSSSVFQALNDIVFRGQSIGMVCGVDCFIDDEYFTTIWGDGLIVATSTGSTAYNLSAGGAMVHPSVSTLIWTPICAHALNAHPLILPDSIKLSFKIAEQSRGTQPYVVSYDGHPSYVEKGEEVAVSISPNCLPTVCDKSPIVDWLHSISTVLRWNHPISQN